VARSLFGDDVDFFLLLPPPFFFFLDIGAHDSQGESPLFFFSLFLFFPSLKFFDGGKSVGVLWRAMADPPLSLFFSLLLVREDSI